MGSLDLRVAAGLAKLSRQVWRKMANLFIENAIVSGASTPRFY